MKKEINYQIKNDRSCIKGYIYREKRKHSFMEKNLQSYDCDFIEKIHSVIYNDTNNKKIIKNITQPVLIVYGEHDPYFTHYMIEDIQKNIKYPRIILIPEGKTFININHSSSLNNIVKYWLNDYF